MRASWTCRGLLRALCLHCRWLCAIAMHQGVARAVAVQEFVALSATVQEMSARAAVDQEMFVLFVAMREVFSALGGLGRTGGTRVHGDRAGGDCARRTPARGAHVRSSCAAELEGLLVAAVTREVTTNADRGARGVHAHHQGPCTPLSLQFRRATTHVTSAARRASTTM